LEAMLGSALLAHLVANGTLVKLSPGIVYTQEAYEDAERRLVAHLEAHGQVTLGEVRDLLGTSRKYAQALIEYLDRMRVTKRVGDARVLRR
jgi:selenocysteine-specific elongation factor